GLPVTFAPSTPAICTVTANQVTSVQAGACTVRASQPGNALYAAAASVDATFNVLTASAPGGVFALPVNYTAAKNVDNVTALVAGDFDGDGILDLAVPGFSSGVWVLRGNVDGTFQPGIRY